MRDDNVLLEGEVIKIERTFYLVKLENDFVVRCRLSGKMRLRKIQVVLGDKVQLRVSSYDTSNGIITYRGK